MDAIVRPPLPSMSSEALPNSRAPSLRGHYPASSLTRARPPPSRRQPISRGHRLYGLPCSADFAAGRGGLLQWLLHVSGSPCRRSHPAGGESPRQPDCDAPCCLRADRTRSASGAWRFRALPLRSLWLRPGNSLTILPMASSMGSRGSVSLRPAIQATGRLALVPVGLSPTEHVCLWIAPCPSPKLRPATRGFEFGSAAWLHGEQNVAETGKDRARPGSLPA